MLSILLELIRYEGRERKVFYLFTYIPYNILYVCKYIGGTPFPSALHTKLIRAK